MISKISFTTFSNVVNDQLRAAKSTYYSFNPATGEKLWPVPVATKQDVDEAVDAALAAFKTWSKIPFQERAEMLKELQKACEPYVTEFGDLLIKETGKPTLFAHGEAKIAIGESFDYFLSLKLPNESVKMHDREYSTEYVPLGVVAAILPWNFPLSQVSLKALPALLAGNCVIVKPSPFTPYSALKMVEIAQQVLPPGVIQVLGGDEKLGPWLTEHAGVAKIAFTGSCATGKRVMAAAAKTLKRVTLELGGNDPAIICEDVDLQKTAQALTMGALFNAGQICATTKRVYVHQKIYKEMLKAMDEVAKKVNMGDVSDPNTYLGPLQNKMQYDKVNRFIEESQQYAFSTTESLNSVNGAKGVGGTSPKGYYIKPRVLDNPPDDSLVVKEEQMGPVLPVQPWTDEEEVIKHANASLMGLGASVWCKDRQRANRIASQLEAGSVFINHAEMLNIRVPFGGFKESGIGVEGGPNGLVSYCNLKVTHRFPEQD